MKVALVVTDSKGKNLSFATGTLEKFSLKRLLVLVEKGRIELLHRVKSKWGIYVRSNPNDKANDNLDVLSISYHKLLKAKDDLEFIIGEPSFRLYWKHYSAYLKHIQKTEEIITVDGYLWTPLDSRAWEGVCYTPFLPPPHHFLRWVYIGVPRLGIRT